MPFWHAKNSPARPRGALKLQPVTSRLLQGVHPCAMKKPAGHDSPKIALGIYIHVNMDERRKAMDAMQGIFN